jgi:hypothetical protein
MFRHVVLFVWSDDATDAQKSAVVEGLRALPGLIDTIRDYRIGADAGLAEGNSDFAVVADFDDRDGYLIYRDHPEHQRVIAELIRPILASRAAVQHDLG